MAAHYDESLVFLKNSLQKNGPNYLRPAMKALAEQLRLVVQPLYPKRDDLKKAAHTVSPVTSRPVFIPLPLIKHRRIMLLPRHRLFYYHCCWIPRTAEEKQRAREEKEAKQSEIDDAMILNQLSVVFRAEYGEHETMLSLDFSDNMSLREVLDTMSKTIATRLGKRVARDHLKKSAASSTVQVFRAEKPVHQSVTEWEDIPFQVRLSGEEENAEELLSANCLESLKRLNRLHFADVPYGIRLLRFPVENVTLPVGPRIGHPLVAAVQYRKDVPEVDVATATKYLRFFWFVSKTAKALTPGSLHWTDEKDRLDVEGCEFREESPVYTPTNRDIGHHMVVAVCDSSEAIGWAAKQASPVEREDEDERRLCEDKVDWCREHNARFESNQYIGVVSYNLLSDTYLNLSKAELFYPFCPKEYQHIKYRYPALMKELTDYDADLMLLQEVCPRMGRQLLPPLLLHRGYEYDFARKFAEVREGSFVAWRSSRFELLSSHREWLADLMENREEFEDIRTAIKGSEELRKIILTRPNQIHIVELRDRETDDVLVCGVTHLHHKGEHEHIKVLQMVAANRELQNRVRKAKARLKESKKGRVRVLFSTDMNSTPEGAVYSFMEKGNISHEDTVWRGDAAMQGIDVQAEPDGVRLFNLSGSPPFTNYTVYKGSDGQEMGFSGCIDFIWGNGLESLGMPPFPPMAEVKKYQALPAKHAPSDHLAIVTHLRYTQ